MSGYIRNTGGCRRGGANNLENDIEMKKEIEEERERGE